MARPPATALPCNPLAKFPQHNKIISVDIRSKLCFISQRIIYIWQGRVYKQLFQPLKPKEYA